jgi:hypothetical protein
MSQEKTNQLDQTTAELTRMQLLIAASEPVMAKIIAHLVVSRMSDEELTELIEAMTSMGEKAKAKTDWISGIVKGLEQ